MNYTNEDLINANKFSNVNLQIRLLHLASEKGYKHLIGKLKIEIRDATDDDYYRPLALISACKIITITISEPLCEALSCTISKEKGLCDPQEAASYYRLGDDKFGIQCQPACFNMSKKRTFNENGEVLPDTPQLNFFENKCRILPSSINTYLEKPYYRSTTHYEKRLNDMPTGFSRNINTKDPFGTGFAYSLNKTYCGYYNSIVLSNGDCGNKWYEIAVSPLLSSKLIDFALSTKRLIFNDGIPFEEPTDLPPFPTEIPKKYTLDGWLNDINPSFMLPNLIDTSPQQQHIDSKNISHSRHQQEYYHHMFSNKFSKSNSSNDDDNDDSDDDQNLDDVFNDLSKKIPVLLDIYLAIKAQKWTKVALKQFKTLCTKLMEKITTLVIAEAEKITEKIGAKVLSNAMRSVIVHSIVRGTIAITGHIAVLLTKMLSAAATVVGVILDIAMFLDLILIFWDPYGYDNMLPANVVKDLYKNGENTLRRMAETPMVTYEFDQLISSILTKDEIAACYIQTLGDTINYLNALVVNSDGSVIDKGKLVNFQDTFSKNKNIEVKKNKLLAKQIQIDNDSYHEYNQDFFERIETYNILSGLTFAFFLTSLTLALLNYKILFAFVLIIFLVSVYLLRLEIQNNLITKFFRSIHYPFTYLTK